MGKRWANRIALGVLWLCGLTTVIVLGAVIAVLVITRGRALMRKVTPAGIAEGDFTARGGELAARQLLDRAPDLDGLFVASDLMALGVLSFIGLMQLGKLFRKGNMLFLTSISERIKGGNNNE